MNTTKTMKLAKSNRGKQVTDMKDLKLSSLEQAASFIRQVISGDTFCNRVERRSSLRYPIALPVLARELDDHLCPVGEPFPAVTRLISEKGLSLFHSQPITANYLELAVTSSNSDAQMGVRLEIVRCQPIGPLFEIAGQFMEQQ